MEENKITVEYEPRWQGRVARIKCNGKEWAYIIQDTDFGKSELETPKNSFYVSSDKSAEYIELTIKVLKKVLQVHRRWNKDTGKHYVSIALIREYHAEYARFCKERGLPQPNDQP